MIMAHTRFTPALAAVALASAMAITIGVSMPAVAEVSVKVGGAPMYA